MIYSGRPAVEPSHSTSLKSAESTVAGLITVWNKYIFHSVPYKWKLRLQCLPQLPHREILNIWCGTCLHKMVSQNYLAPKTCTINVSICRKTLYQVKVASHDWMNDYIMNDLYIYIFGILNANCKQMRINRVFSLYVD